MKVEQFCNTAENIARNYITQYKLGGIGEHNGDLWYFDCVGLIKSILWGWCGDTKYSRGGAVYGRNGVPDVGANKMFETYCYDKSTNFANIQRGELVWMDGHIGIYIGNGLVVEATSAWENKVLISNVGSGGERTYNGKRVYKWTHHGKCQFLEYSVDLKYKVGDKIILNGYLHTGTALNSGDVGYYENYKGTITKIDNSGCEYPYFIDNLGWTREKYLTLNEDNTDYEILYKQELLKNKDLEKQVENLQAKIDKALNDLK